MRLDRIHPSCFILLLFAAGAALAQKDAQSIYEGNQLYHSGKVPQSSARYARALELNPTNRKANFNLGASLYKNGMLMKSGALAMPANSKMTADSMANMIFDQAAQNFAVVANSISNTDTLHQAWHNIGNCYLQKKDYRQAADAYKKALKFDPKDEETRYNLAYALKHMPKEEKKGGGGQKNQPQNKKEEDKDAKDKNAQPQQGQMSKEQAEQLLKALMESEKKQQDKRKQKPEDASKSPTDKDW